VDVVDDTGSILFVVTALCVLLIIFIGLTVNGLADDIIDYNMDVLTAIESLAKDNAALREELRAHDDCLRLHHKRVTWFSGAEEEL